MSYRIIMTISQLVRGHGGCEQQALRLGSALIARGHEVEILTSRPAGAPREEVMDGVPVRRLFIFGNRRGLWRLGIYSYMALLSEELLRRRGWMDVVHVHQAFHAAYAAVATRPLHRCPVLVKIATAGRYGDLQQMQKGTGSIPGSSILLPTVLRADRLVAISDEIRGELLLAGVEQERIARIPNGVVLPQGTVTPDARYGARRSLGLPEDGEVVVYVGRCQPQKAPELLLAAWRRLRERPRCHLLVLGEGFLTDPRFRAEQAESSRLHLYGRVTEVPRYLRAADALIHPSRGEGLSNSLLEALSLGVPCVASGIAANEELLRDGAGLLAPPEDGDTLADLCAILLDSPDRRRALALGGRRRAEEFDLGRVCARYEALYAELLDGQQGTAPRHGSPETGVWA